MRGLAALDCSGEMQDSRLENESGIVALLGTRFGAEVVVTRREPLSGDASSRRYVRLSLAGDGVPATVVAMVMEDAEAAKTSDEGGEQADCDEIPFVNVGRFLARLGVAVPEIYVDASDIGVLVLEDVGDVPLWDAVVDAPESEVRRLFGLAIEQLLRIQIEGTKRADPHCVGFCRNFDESLYMWELEHFLEWGFSGRLDATLPRSEEVELRRSFSDLAAFLGAQPRVLNHRDYHAWNLHVCDGKIRVIDFQDMLLAAAPYDLATLLGDRTTPSVVTRVLESELVGDYGRAWNAHPDAPWYFDSDRVWQVYTACAVQKAFKVVGRFHFLDRVKGKPGYLRFIPPTLERIRGLLLERDDMSNVHEILQKYFEELRS